MKVTITLSNMTFSFLELETFLSDVLKGENLSKKTKDKKESLIKKIKDVKFK